MSRFWGISFVDRSCEFFKILHNISPIPPYLSAVMLTISAHIARNGLIPPLRINRYRYVCDFPSQRSIGRIRDSIPNDTDTYHRYFKPNPRTWHVAHFASNLSLSNQHFTLSNYQIRLIRKDCRTKPGLSSSALPQAQLNSEIESFSVESKVKKLY